MYSSLTSSLVFLIAASSQNGFMANAQTYLFSFGDSYTATGFNPWGPQPGWGNPMGNPPEGTVRGGSMANKTRILFNHTLNTTGAGTWTGGYNWVDFVTTQVNQGHPVFSYNFAQAGATVDNGVCSVDGSIPCFLQQIGDMFAPAYPQWSNGWNSGNSIFTIWFGINDILTTYNNPGDVAWGYMCRILDSYFYGLDQLYNLGARKFLVMGVPPFDRSPEMIRRGPDQQNMANGYINNLNWFIWSRANDWAGSKGDVRMDVYDTHSVWSNILNNPGGFGFNDNTCDAGAWDGCMWWWETDLHATSQMHANFANDLVWHLFNLGM